MKTKKTLYTDFNLFYYLRSPFLAIPLLIQKKRLLGKKVRTYMPDGDGKYFDIEGICKNIYITYRLYHSYKKPYLFYDNFFLYDVVDKTGVNGEYPTRTFYAKLIKEYSDD